LVGPVERSVGLVDQLERADSLLVAVNQRRAQQAACAITALLVDGLIESSVGIGVVDADRAAGLDDLSHDALIVRQPEPPPFHAQRRAGDELPLVAVPQKNARPLAAEQLGRL